MIPMKKIAVHKLNIQNMERSNTKITNIIEKSDSCTGQQFI